MQGTLLNTLEKYGIELIAIPAEDFLMGDEDQSDNPPRTVYLDAYSISKHPVTVKQYLAFCAATGHEEPPSPDFNPDWKYEDHPIVNVSWDDAQAYCVWLGKQIGQHVTLPTEAQWEKAARGTEGRRYPWGDAWDGSRCANSVEPYDLSGTVAVGSYPLGASPYGVLDMVGNVWEWCSDWYDSEYMKMAHARNPIGSSSGGARVFRGGSWLHLLEENFRCAYRDYLTPDSRSHSGGFRCVVSAEFVVT